MSDTSETPELQTGVTTSIRVVSAICVAITLALFILIWDGKYINGYGWPEWLGPFVFLPVIFMTLGFFINSLIQYLSCKKVHWLSQFARVAVSPAPLFALWGLLYIIPSIRWPIEGLVQDLQPETKKGLSSGFYVFWIGLYTQSIMNGLAQICPDLTQP